MMSGVQCFTKPGSMPMVRGPVQLAKSLAALNILSDGHLIASVGPGSLPQDYALVGIAFEERWKRFDKAIQLLRTLLHRNAPPFRGQFYAEASPLLEPFPAQGPDVPIWIGSWGSEAGLRRVACLGGSQSASHEKRLFSSLLSLMVSVDALARRYSRSQRTQYTYWLCCCETADHLLIRQGFGNSPGCATCLCQERIVSIKDKQ